MIILKIIKNICVNFNRLLFTIGFCLVTTHVVEAKTIYNNNYVGNSNYITMFENMFERSDYPDYLLSIENVTSGYSSYDNYYFCLSNKVEVTNQLTAKANCEEMYLYSRDNNSSYHLEKINDNYLEVSNSVYYKSVVHDNIYWLRLFGTSILILMCFYLTWFIFKEVFL